MNIKPYLERDGVIFEGIDAIRERLYPRDSSYSAEPLEIDEARWLLRELDRYAHLVESMTHAAIRLS